MAEPIDLLTAVQDAAFARLSGAGLAWPVFQHVPENIQPPMIVLGDIAAGPGDSKTDETITFDILFAWRGAGRRPLLAMLHATRCALDAGPNHRAPPLEGAGIEPANAQWRESETEKDADDGVSYFGRQRYSVLAEPA